MTTAKEYFENGNSKYDLEKYEEAIEDYDEAIKLDSKYTLAYRNRGKAKFYLKKYKESIEDYDKAIKLDFNDAAAYHNRGNSKFYLKHYEEAIEDYDEAIKLDPNPETYHNRGKAKFELKKYEEAIIDFNRAIVIAMAFNIPCAKTFNIRASARAELIFAHVEEVFKDYNKAIELDVNNKERYNGYIDNFINRLKYYINKNI